MPYRFLIKKGGVYYLSKQSRKRFLRKVEKKKQIRATHSGRKLSNKQLDRIDNIDNALLIYQKKDVKRDKAIKLHTDKIKFLNENLIDVSKLRYKDIDRLKVKDMKNGTFNLMKYPEYNRAAVCDFYKKMKFLDDTRLYVAYQDYTGENSFEYILNEFKKYPALDLLTLLKDIVNKSLTGIKDVPGTSGGKAGTAIWNVGTSYALLDEYVKVSSTNRHLNSKQGKKSRLKIHKGTNKGYQRLTNAYDKATHDSMSAYDLLVIINALLYNVTEKDRSNLYNKFYNDIEENALYNEDENWMKFFKLLPKPDFWG